MTLGFLKTRRSSSKVAFRHTDVPRDINDPAEAVRRHVDNAGMGSLIITF